MFKNYFYLLRNVNELNVLLKDKTVYDIYSQEKNVLFLDISDNKFPHKHIIISAAQNFPYIYVKEEHHKAKKNLIELQKEKLPAKIISVSISTDDRVIYFHLSSFDFYFLIHGNNTNIFFENNNNFIPFTKTFFNFNEFLKNKKFTNEMNFYIPDETVDIIDDLKIKYPQITKEIKEEIIFRVENKLSPEYNSAFKNVVTEILRSNICVKYFHDLRKTKFFPVSFYTFKNNCDKSFTTFNTAFAEYLRSFYKNRKKDLLVNDLNKFFNTQLSKLSNKMNKLKARIDKGSLEETYRTYANLLSINRHLIKKGMNKIELKNYETNESVTIKLDPKISVNKNIDRYFEKASDEKINYKKSLELFNFTNEKYYNLLKQKEIFEQADALDIIEELHDKLINRSEKIIKMESGQKFKYWHYLINDKYHVYVGRDSKSNDYLSLKFAKQNDYWFHARGLPGSHVILRVENTKENIPKDVIKKAAALAAYYSKAKTAGTAPVSYTFAKYVHKKKGMLPGKVLLSKENTILVKPDIPKNCILNEE